MTESITDLDNRIKVAEFIGWELRDVETYSFVDPSKKRYHKQWHRPDGITYSGIKLPDPKDDVNDDYAILKFMREQPDKKLWRKFVLNLQNQFSENYQIGDYYRSVLKGLV